MRAESRADQIKTWKEGGRGISIRHGVGKISSARATSVILDSLSLSLSPLRGASRGLIRIALGCRSDEPWRAPRESNIDRRSSGLTSSQEGESSRREEGGERSRVAERAREREKEMEELGRGGWWLLEGRRANAHNRGQRVGAASLFLCLSPCLSSSWTRPVSSLSLFASLRPSLGLFCTRLFVEPKVLCSYLVRLKVPF